MVDLRVEKVDSLVRALEGEFYVVTEHAREAVRRRSSFNVIHLQSMFKVDLFVLGNDPASRLEMSRRERATLSDGSRLYSTAPRFRFVPDRS